MKTAKSRVIISHIITLSLLTFLGLAMPLYWQWTKTGSPTTTASLPTIRGEAALAHLKEQGLYSSLGEAVKAARYTAQPLPSGKAFQFVNSDNRLRATFDLSSRSGTRVATSINKRQRELAIKLTGYGYGPSLIALSPRTVDATESRRVYALISNLKS